ncbi:MAG: peptidoglycan-associated lipoprotein Pal [Geobacteraceae bacterium]
MSKSMMRCLVVLCCGALLASGCAKKEMVKQEEPIAPALAQPVQPKEQAESTVEEEAVQSQPVKAVPAAITEETIGQAAKTALGSALTTIYFDFDSALLSQASRDILNKNAGILKKNNTMKIKIEGNSDERGSDEYNLALGERRAKSAMNYLVTLGVQPDRLSIISYGEEKPADPGHDEAAWAKNRRDELVTVK